MFQNLSMIRVLTNSFIDDIIKMYIVLSDLRSDQCYFAVKVCHHLDGVFICFFIITDVNIFVKLNCKNSGLNPVKVLRVCHDDKSIFQNLCCALELLTAELLDVLFPVLILQTCLTLLFRPQTVIFCKRLQVFVFYQL